MTKASLTHSCCAFPPRIDTDTLYLHYFCQLKLVFYENHTPEKTKVFEARLIERVRLLIKHFMTSRYVVFVFVRKGLLSRWYILWSCQAVLRSVI